LIEYWRLQKFIRSFPGAQVHREGPADAKGNLIPDKFSFEAVRLENPPILDLCSKTLILCKELQAFLRLHGPEPKVERQLPETPEVFQQRWRSVVLPWRAKFHGDYRAKFGQAVPQIRDEIKAKQGFYDVYLDEFIKRAENNPNGDIEAVEKISTTLWNIALKVDD